jgi:hypothetical protein
MKKAVKIAIISVAAVAVVVGVLFVVIPLATSKEVESKLGEVLAEVGIPEDMWSVDRAYYVPLFGYTVENLEFGERDGSGFLKAKKVTLSFDTDKEDLFAGSVDARDLSFSADDASITVKVFSVNDFSVDKALFEYSPVEAVKKVGNIRLHDAVFRQKGRKYFSLERLNIDAGYTEGEIPLSSSMSLKEFVIDVRQFSSLPALRPAYRFSNVVFKNSLSDGVYATNLVIDGVNLFTIKADFGISMPQELQELLTSGETSNYFALIGYYAEYAKLDSFALTYTDKSFLNHLFELTGMPDGKEDVVEELTETIVMLAMRGGIDEERLVDEVTKFIAKPGKFELKMNSDSPVSFEEIGQNPFAMNLSLSINGGKSFTFTDEY